MALLLPLLLPLMVLSCWAPEIVTPTDPGAPEPAVAPPPAQGWPAPPFTAWTTRAPTSVVGPGGAPLALISRAGVRVEVLQVLPARVRLRCDGCEGPAAGVEGWLQADAITWPGGPELPADHALRRALELRAAWARGQDLPPGVAQPDALCALVDGGYQGDPPAWGEGDSKLTLRREGDHWLPPALTGAPAEAPGACAVTPGIGTPPAPG